MLWLFWLNLTNWFWFKPNNSHFGFLSVIKVKKNWELPCNKKNVWLQLSITTLPYCKYKLIKLQNVNINEDWNREANKSVNHKADISLTESQLKEISFTSHNKNLNPYLITLFQSTILSIIQSIRFVIDFDLFPTKTKKNILIILGLNLFILKK